MGLDELIGQRLVFGIPGPRVTRADVRLFRDTHAGGLILYRINFRSPEQIRRLVRDLEEALGRSLLVTVDHEGGRVIMFESGVTIFPDNLAFGAAGRVDWSAAEGRHEGRELRRLGMDVAFSPTVDVLTPAFSPNIGIRSYGRDPKQVAALAVARLREIQAQGVSACAKHFPGLGPATRDPHLDLPVILTDWKEWRRVHRPPFEACLKAGVALVMSSHPLYPRLDPTPRTPATFSRRLIHDLLRKDMGYTGVIASDDLEMGALWRLSSVGRAAVKATTAGHDLLLCCHRADWQRAVFHELKKAYESKELSVPELERSVERIRKLPRGRGRKTWDATVPPSRSGERLAERVARGAVTVTTPPRGVPLPLTATAPLVLFPDFRPLASKIMIEKELLNPRKHLRERLKGSGRSPRVETLSINPTAGEIARALSWAGSAPATVFFCFDAFLQPGCARLLKKLEALGRPLVVVLLRNPYDVEKISRSTSVTCYGFRRSQIDACLEKIFC